MVTPEQAILTEDRLGSLLIALPFSDSQRRDVECHTRTRGIIQATIQTATNEYACLFEQTVEPLAGLEQRVLDKHQELQRNNFWSILARVRRNIFTHPDFRPPLILEPFKLLGIRKPDPRDLELQAAQRNLDQVRTQVNNKVRSLDGSKLGEIDKQYVRLENEEKNILAISRGVAATTDDFAFEAFAIHIPWQIPQLASDYARYWASSEKMLGNFNEFVTLMYERFKYRREASEYKVSAEGYKSLDPRIQTCWTAFVEYRKLQELFQKRLLKAEPKIPDIILRIGANLDL